MEPESECIENCTAVVELTDQGDMHEECTLHKITTTEDMTNTSPPVKHKLIRTDKSHLDEIASASAVMLEDKISNSNSGQGAEEKRSTLKRILRRRSNTCSQLNDWMSNVLTKKRN